MKCHAYIGKEFLFDTEGDDDILMESPSKTFIVYQDTTSGKESDAADHSPTAYQDWKFKLVMKQMIF